MLPTDHWVKDVPNINEPAIQAFIDKYNITNALTISAIYLTARRAMLAHPEMNVACYERSRYYRKDIPETDRMEMDAWLLDVLMNRPVHLIRNKLLAFASEDDALMFKLVWGH